MQSSMILFVFMSIVISTTVHTCLLPPCQEKMWVVELCSSCFQAWVKCRDTLECRALPKKLEWVDALILNEQMVIF